MKPYYPGDRYWLPSAPIKPALRLCKEEKPATLLQVFDELCDMLFPYDYEP